MTHQWELPDKRTWRFDELLALEPQRVRALEAATSPTVLLEAMRVQLHSAILADTFRVGLDQACKQPQDLRAVIQFPVTTEFFDCFFNSRVGYRAHFRAHFECGLQFNATAVDLLRNTLQSTLQEAVAGRLLNCKFEDIGEARPEREFLMRSLDPPLSKLWFCTKLIQREGGVKDLPPGITGPRIALPSDEYWPAPYQDGEEAWLDLKGGFVGVSSVYQIKDPVKRAHILHATGSA